MVASNNHTSSLRSWALPSPGTTAEGQCSMRGSCGTKGFFGKPLPCPYDGPPVEPENDSDRALLVSVCGAEFSKGPVCCTSDQLETLRESLNQAESIIASCPACRNNFRSFYCAFTCSPNQASFLQVTSTQKSQTGEIAVKSVDFRVATNFAQGFFNSCKDVQFAASNGYAMDFIGGGAKNYSAFLKFMGDEKSLGSPFQINYPHDTPPELPVFDMTPRNCSDNDLASRCTCIDCPDICQALPYVPPPNAVSTCHIGPMSCLTLSLTVLYGLALVSFIFGYVLRVTIRNRRDSKYERLVLSPDAASDSNPLTNSHGLVGASSLAHYVDGDDSLRSQSESQHLGRGASLLDPIETVQPRQYYLNNILRRFFYRLGMLAGSYPYLTFVVVFTLIGLLNFGWKNFDIEKDPVRLWVAPDSQSKLEKDFFDQNFGPFYRPQQIFVTSVPTFSNEDQNSSSLSTSSKPAVLTWDHLRYWFEVEREIRSLRSFPNGYRLQDVCFKPAGPTGACVVQSLGAWFGNSLDDYDEDTWSDHLLQCANSPVDCLPDFQQPLAPEFVLGGVPKDSSGSKQYLDAEAFVVTYVVSDSLDEAEQERAMEWERILREYLLNLSEAARMEVGLEIAFSTGVSLEEELNKSTNTDVKIVVLSYLAMFFYVSLTLGAGAGDRSDHGFIASLYTWATNIPKLFSRSRISPLDSRNNPTATILPRLPRSFFIRSKVILGLFGIILVILSVASSVGFFSAIHVKVTLIIAEVIPFLVLAVGVDNVFILVHELDRQNKLHGPNTTVYPTVASSASPIHHNMFEYSHDESVEEPLAGSSYLSAEERVARTLAKMGPSILLSTITETVAFALGALVPMPAVRNFALYAAGSVLLNAILQTTVFVSALALDLRRNEDNRIDCFPCIRLPSHIALPDSHPISSQGRITRFIRRHYVPFLLKSFVKGFVLLAFGGIFVLSVISIQHIELGLEQQLALPSDSYLVEYFNNLASYLDVGPPVYFVSINVNVTRRTGQQHLCGRFTTCDVFSLANVLEAERKRPESSFISEPTAVWIDDYMNWLDPAKETCCRVRKGDPSVFCSDRDPDARCRPCFAGREPAWNITMNGFPEGEEFMLYLRQWLASPTSENCPLAGKASFGTALSLAEDDKSVVASHFRTSHSPLRTQADFIHSLQAAHRIADEISERTGSTVFPYSLHYVYFDQYLHVIAITQEILGFGLASVLIITALLLGSWRTGSIVTGVVALTIVSVMGVMGIWGISLNAVSLVNLVISLGIAVEFCAHVARAFMSAGSGLPVDHPAGQKERDERMGTALADVGPSVLSGITFTKLIGMSVLALTRSKLLEVYYFRMWLTLIISGALHGLVLLPVILSLAGGAGFPMQEADEEWMSNVIRNDYEYAPFIADDESTTSD